MKRKNSSASPDLLTDIVAGYYPRRSQRTAEQKIHIARYFGSDDNRLPEKNIDDKAAKDQYMSYPYTQAPAQNPLQKG